MTDSFRFCERSVGEEESPTLRIEISGATFLQVSTHAPLGRTLLTTTNDLDRVVAEANARANRRVEELAKRVMTCGEGGLQDGDAVIELHHAIGT